MSTQRFAALDGLRGIAVIAVVLFHLWPGRFPAGFLGVNLFFVLSGFLVTRAFSDSTQLTTPGTLGWFWRRRVLRLLPAECLLLATVWIVWLLRSWWSTDLGGELRLSALQVMNWKVVLTPDYYAGLPTPVSHLWSLSIEVQLYLLLTVVMLLTSRRREVITVLCAGNIAFIAVMLATGSISYNVAYASTFTRSAEFCFGVLLALWWREGNAQHDRGLTGAKALLILSVSVFCVLVLLEEKGGGFVRRGGLVLTGAISCVAMWTALSLRERVPRGLSRGPLPVIGKVSYGVYLYHWPVFLGLTRAGVGSSLRGWLTLLVTAAVTALSYRFVEEPLQRWGRRERISQSAAAVRTTR